MSNDPGGKADQIAHRLYTKLIQLVNHARATPDPPATAKVDKWFNLETPDADLFKEHTRIYRNLSAGPVPPPFRLDVLLAIPELATNQVLVHVAPDSTRTRIDPTPRHILLESWELAFSTARRAGQDVQPPTFYKHGIALFRSVFTLLRLLPAWKVVRRQRRRGGPARNGQFGIELCVREANAETVAPRDMLDFDSPPHLPTTKHAFPPIIHPAGSLALSVTVLEVPVFQVDELEALLSDRFLSDDGPAFTPTLVARSTNTSNTSLPPPLSRSPPRSQPSSVADRFIVAPPHRRTTSLTGATVVNVPLPGSPRLGGSPRTGNVVLPGPSSRRLSVVGASGPGSASGMSDASSSRQGGSRDDIQQQQGQGVPMSTLQARLQRESFGMGRGSDVPSPGPVPIRRPPAPIYPFKTATLSSGSPSLHSPSSLSQRHNSPLPSGPSLPARPVHSPTSSRSHAFPGTPGRPPPSPLPPARPSPPFQPSSLGDRRSLASVEEVPGRGSPIPGASHSPRLAGKRYSSTFGHRHATSAGEARPASPAFLGTTTDDDDIAAFVQEIDGRRPLGRPASTSSSPGLRLETQVDAGAEADILSPIGLSHALSTLRDPYDPYQPAQGDVEAEALRVPTLPAPLVPSVRRELPTTADAVDAQLREMTDAFQASLQGLRRERGHSRQGTVRSTAPRPPLDPLAVGSAGTSGSGSGSGSGNVSEGRMPLGTYGRPRMGSTASARSGMSVASGEVLGRMDPEVPEDGVHAARR